MIEIRCPWCGPRVSAEFVHDGITGATRPDAATASIEAWRSYLFGHENSPGWVDEEWLHLAGCGEFVRVRRHLVTNEIASTTPEEAGGRS